MSEHRWRCDLCGVGGTAADGGPDPFTAHYETRRHRFNAALPRFLRRLLVKLRAEKTR